MMPREAAQSKSALWALGLFAVLGYAYIGAVLALFALITYLLIARGYGGLAFASGGMLVFVLSALRVRLPPPVGRVVTASEAPDLFRLLEEVRRGLDGPTVHEVVLTPDVNASVVDLPRYALFGSRRRLTLGVPLLGALPADEVRAIIAHEIAHLAHHGRARLWSGRIQATWSALAMSVQWSGSWARSYSFRSFDGTPRV